MINLTDRFLRNLLSIITLCIAVAAFVCAKEYDPLKTQYFSPTGRIQKGYKVWDAIVTPTTATGMSVDISSAGFTSISTVELTAANNTTTVTSMPIVAIQTYSTTSVSFNLLTSNSGVLGILQGLVGATSLTGLTVHVHITGQ